MEGTGFFMPKVAFPYGQGGGKLGVMLFSQTGLSGLARGTFTNLPSRFTIFNLYAGDDHATNKEYSAKRIPEIN
jgi:hypothetical protein